MLPRLLPLFLSTATAISLPGPQAFFSNPTANDDVSNSRIPSIHESAVQARRILRLENIGTLSTIFPSHHDTTESRPSDVGGTPIGLMDYFADCEKERGDPTILAINIATSFRNAAAGSNITLSLRWHPPYKPARPYSAASVPRFSLIGHLEPLTDEEIRKQLVSPCFVASHPDAVAWLPGNPIHESYFARLVVEDIYWIGGFGNVAYIGWIPVEEWRSVTQQEIHDTKLPGEKNGWFFENWFVEL